MKKSEITSLIGNTFKGFKDRIEDRPVKKGKVREMISLDDQMVIITTDRISAFDRVLTTIPCKGEVLNRLSLFWFQKTQDIVKNHLLQEVTPRTVRVKKCQVLPVEVVVRGYLTGSAWRDYQEGNAVSGIRLPEGMKMNQKFEKPLITPSTKAEEGEHDAPISSEEVVSSGLVEKKIWEDVKRIALELFARGTEVAEKNGLILVDTKYEFGLLDHQVYLIDEVHTPDSSRFWYADTYQELFRDGEKQRKIDKEYLRQWLMEQGFMGDGEIPVIPDEVKTEVAWRYIQAYENITGESFIPQGGSQEEEEASLKKLLAGV